VGFPSIATYFEVVNALLKSIVDWFAL
jgi:hypothetical protein